ncbi:kalirin-like [Dermacentor albipictus]|uniref:kalirin-like n=1 Tax=Dermacentor albipictus TaxID=60249 RepID=UPI0031FBC154
MTKASPSGSAPTEESPPPSPSQQLTPRGSPCDERPSPWRRVASFTAVGHRAGPEDGTTLRNGRPWSLRLKKTYKSDKKHRKSQDDNSLSTEGNSPTEPTPASVVAAAPGSRAVLRCQLDVPSLPSAAGAVSWRLPDGSSLRARAPGDGAPVLFRMGASVDEGESAASCREQSLADRCVARLHADGSSSLEVAQCEPLDAGLYVCDRVVDGATRLAASTRLVVAAGKPNEPGRPELLNAQGTKLQLKWEPAQATDDCPMTGYVVEKTIKGLNAWEPAGPATTLCTQVIHCDPGCYTFRVVSHSELGTSNPGPPSDAITVTGDTAKSQSGVVEWKKNFSGYVEVRECGRGRFSVVKKCINNVTGERVAAKVIGFQQQSRATVEHECRMLASLQHDGIVELLECYRTPSSHILVFPFIEGLRLFDHVCVQWSFYSEHTVSHYLAQLLSALDYIHLCGIAHLDIKPENLLVEECSDRLKLIDFGNARRVFGDECKMSVIGTAEFMAPEVLKNYPLSTRADLWSTGVLLYVFLVGLSPFLGATENETCANIEAAAYAIPTSASVSEHSLDLISKLLAANPQKRLSASKALAHYWIKEAPRTQNLSSSPLREFVKRRDELVGYKVLTTGLTPS